MADGTFSNSEAESTGKTNTVTDSKQPKSVKVQIQGRSLAVRTTHDPAFVQKLAHYVDQQAEQIGADSAKIPTEKRLLLTCMMIAEELFESKERIADLESRVQKETRAMLEKIDNLDLDDISATS